MINRVLVLVVFTCVFIAAGCSGSRKAKGMTKANPALLKQQAERLINCLNQRDYDCLYELHADDFEGWSPAVSFTEKPGFIKKMVSNYEESNLWVKAGLREVRMGPEQGYVYLDWTLSSRTDGLETMLLDQRCLQIWTKSSKGQWQLTRSLFY